MHDVWVGPCVRGEVDGSGIIRNGSNQLPPDRSRGCRRATNKQPPNGPTHKPEPTARRCPHRKPHTTHTALAARTYLEECREGALPLQEPVLPQNGSDLCPKGHGHAAPFCAAPPAAQAGSGSSPPCALSALSWCNDDVCMLWCGLKSQSSCLLKTLERRRHRSQAGPGGSCRPCFRSRLEMYARLRRKTKVMVPSQRLHHHKNIPRALRRAGA